MKLTMRENGPIVVETRETFTCELGDEKREDKGPIFLCRCGQSANKPFCDGAHKKAGFEAPAAGIAMD